MLGVYPLLPSDFPCYESDVHKGLSLFGNNPSRHPLIAHPLNNRHNYPVSDNNVEDKSGQSPYNSNDERLLKLEPLSFLSPDQQRLVSALTLSNRSIRAKDGELLPHYEKLYQSYLKQQQTAKEAAHGHDGKSAHIDHLYPVECDHLNPE